MIDDFTVKTVYEGRTYKRYRISLKVDGRDFKGDYHEGEIRWMNPHPKQSLKEAHLKSIEVKVYESLVEYGIK